MDIEPEPPNRPAELQPLVILCCLFFTGVTAGEYLPAAFSAWLTVSLILLGATFPFCRRGKLFRWACLVFFLAGLLRMQADRVVPSDDLRRSVTQERRSVSVTGRVLEDGEWNAGERKLSFLVRVEEPGMRGLARVIVHRVQRPIPLYYGDQVRLSGDLFAPRPPTNPAEFDYAAYLAGKKIFAFLSLRDPSGLIVTGTGPEWSLLRFSQKMKVRFCGYLDRAYTPEDAALQKGILFSDRSDLSSRVRREFSISGLAHVLTVSGMNVSLIAAGFFLGFRLLGLPRKKAVVFCLAGILFYTLMTGIQAPVVRSALMFLLWGIALLLDRDTDFYVSIAFSAFLILLADPAQLFQLSFQLTYLATLAIFGAGVPLGRWLADPTRTKEEDVVEAEITLEPTRTELFFESRGFRRARLWTLEALAVSFSVQAVLFPLLAWQFHYVPLTAFPANLVVVPWMGLLMAAGILICFLGPVSTPLLTWTGQLTAPVTHGFGAFVSFSAGLPYSHLAMARFPLGFVLTVYLLLALLLVPALRRFRKVLAVVLAVWFLVFSAWQVGHQLCRPLVQIWFLDVGQGDCIVLFLGHRTIVVDGGPGGAYDAGERILTPFLYSEGVRTVDLAVSTHPHADHTGGLPALLSNFKVRSVVDSGRIYSGNRPFRSLMEKIGVGRVPFRQAREGEDLARELGLKDMKLTVLNTASAAHRCLNPRHGANLDDDSVVLRLTASGTTLLLTGDIREKAQQTLIQKEGLRADLLKAPHHGGDGGMVTGFYRAVGASDVVLTAGQGNRFGFPGKKTLELLGRMGARTWVTGQQGALKVEGGDVGMRVAPFVQTNAD